MKKLVALLMLVAMTLGFVVGCSSPQEEGTTSTGEPAAQEEVQGEAQEEATEEAGEETPAAGEAETETEQQQ